MDQEEMIRDLREIEGDIKELLEKLENFTNPNIKTNIIELETRMINFIDRDYGI